MNEEISWLMMTRWLDEMNKWRRDAKVESEMKRNNSMRI
jgi:hypothetical protein